MLSRAHTQRRTVVVVVGGESQGHSSTVHLQGSVLKWKDSAKHSLLLPLCQKSSESVEILLFPDLGQVACLSAQSGRSPIDRSLSSEKYQQILKSGKKKLFFFLYFLEKADSEEN